MFLYKQGDPQWFFWRKESQGYCDGSVPAPSKRAALERIKEEHPNWEIKVVLHQQEYFGHTLGL